MQYSQFVYAPKNFNLKMKKGFWNHCFKRFYILFWAAKPMGLINIKLSISLLLGTNRRGEFKT